jgi:choline dehydrogenase-like flavoprotein
MTEPIRAHVLVIGSGPGGAVTACHLAEAGREVVLAEEGAAEDQGACPPFSREEMERRYRNGGLTLALGGAKVNYVEARCVGGGSEINSGLYHRTPPEVLARWAERFDVRELTPESLAPHFEACERDLSVSLLPGTAPAASLKLYEGAQRLGWSAMEVPRWYRFGGAAPQGGERQSMTRTYLPRAWGAGCRLVAGVRVTRLRREGNGWWAEGWRTDPGAERTLVFFRADTVFLAGGAVQTPLLLRRNRLAGGAGRTLRMHPTVKITARFPEAVNRLDTGVPVHQVKHFAPRFSFGGSISTLPHLALSLVDYPEALRRLPEQWPHFCVYYAMTGGGMGSVSALPGWDDALVRYRLDGEALAMLSEALRRLAELLLAAGATELYPSLAGGPVLRGPADLERIPALLPAARVRLMTIHLFSSCRMGERDGLCVADSFGKVHGQEGLYIADASLLCDAPGVNPQGTIMAIARRNALRFLGAA